MFGVMFGDIAHGGLLLIFGMFLILKEDSLKVILII
jgi:vacuolar-type H+-ATPase subunit I/STV1